MQKKNKEMNKGITLIALIITIIVMLILVGVTISVALNGGLFSTAKNAAKQTQIEADRDLLSSAVWAAIGQDGTIDFSKLDSNLPNGFTGSNGRYKSDKGNKFIVDKEEGTITYREPSTGDLLLLERYFLGDNGEGKDLFSLVENPDDINDFVDIIFSNEPNIIPNAKEELTILGVGDFIETGENSAYGFIYIEFSNKFYKLYIYCNEADGYLCKDIELVYEKKGREGEKVKYDGNNDGIEEDWMILYDNGDNVEIVSAKNMGELALGYKDMEAQTPGDIDKDGVANTDIDKSIYSYNNAIERLNNYCKSLVTNPNAISTRSIGSNPDNPSTENNKLYESENLKRLNSAYNGIGKSGDTNYESDLMAMICNRYTSEGEKFWLASRKIEDIGNRVDFYIQNAYYPIENGLNTDYNSIYWIRENGKAQCPNGEMVLGSGTQHNVTYGVRPVVKVSSDSV